MFDNIAKCVLLFCAVLFIFYLSRKNSNFVDVRNILRDHFNLLKNDKFTLFIFLFLPIASALSCAFLQRITDDIINSINIILPIFIGLQFSVAGILCSISKSNDKFEKIKKSAFNEILFESVLSILALMASFMVLFIGVSQINDKILLIVSFVIYFLLFDMVMNTFIVLKRLKFLFDES